MIAYRQYLSTNGAFPGAPSVAVSQIRDDAKAPAVWRAMLREARALSLPQGYATDLFIDRAMLEGVYGGGSALFLWQLRELGTWTISLDPASLPTLSSGSPVAWVASLVREAPERPWFIVDAKLGTVRRVTGEQAVNAMREAVEASMDNRAA